MADKIEFDDLASEEAFNKFIAYGEKMIATYDKLEVSIKNAMSQLKGPLGNSPKSVGDVETLTVSIKKADDYSKSLAKIADAKKRIIDETDKARVEEIRLQQAREKNIDKYNAQLKKEEEAIQKVADAKKKASETAAKNAEKERLAEIKLAQDREKAFDKFEKSINKQASYPAQLRAMQKEMIALVDKGVKPGEKAFDDLAKKAGALKDKISDAKQTIQAFAADSKSAVAKNLFGQIGSDISNLDFEGAADKAKQFAVVMQSISFKETLNGIKALGSSILDVGKAMIGNPFIALAAAIAAITYASYKLVTAFKQVEYQTMAVSDAIIEQRKLLEDYANRVVSANIKIAQAMGRITKQQADAMQEDIKNKKENKDLQGKYKDDLINLAKELNVSLVTLQMDRIKATATNDYVALANIERFTKEKAKLDTMYKKTFITLTKSQTMEALAIEIQSNIDRANEAKKSIKESREQAQQDHDDRLQMQQDFQKKLRDLRTENIGSDYERRKKEILDSFDDESKEYAGHHAILVELEIKKNKALEELWLEREAKNKKILQDAHKDEFKKMENVEDPVLSYKVKERVDADKKIEKLNDKEVEDALNTADRVLKIYEERYQKLAEIRRKELDDEVDKRQANIDNQIRLAATGRDNTLSYEMKKKDEAEKARAEELEREKKHAKAMEAVELSLAFIKAYEGYIGKGSNGFQALSKAARDIAAAKILGTLIAGSAEKGTENTGKENGPGLDGKGGRLWMLHDEEGVVNKKGNKKYDGAVGAMNDGNLEDWAMKNLYRPQFESNVLLADVNKKQQVDSALTSLFINKIESLEKTIRDKPETTINWDSLNNLIYRVKENGNTKTTIKKTHL